MTDIIAFVDALPHLLKYIIPGYITLLIVYFLTNKKPGANSQWILSGVISYVTVVLLEYCAYLRDKPWISWGLIVSCVLIDAILGIVYSKFIQSTFWRTYVSKYFGIATRKETISYFVDWENGSNVHIVLKTMDQQILGHIKTVGDGENDDGMICISEPVLSDEYGNEIYSREGENVHMIIPIADIKFIEIIN